MTAEPTVFVVDDDPAVRDSIRWLMESVGLRVETFDRAQDFLDACDVERAGCLVLDVRMPGMSGLEAQSVLAERGITLPVIFITGYGDVSTAVRAMREGAVDFVEKPLNDQVLLDRIQKSIERDAENRRQRALRADIRARLATLTPREREVMELVVAGRPNKAIARTLGVSVKTVEAHRAKVMTKMQAGSVAELVQMMVLYKPLRENPIPVK